MGDLTAAIRNAGCPVVTVVGDLMLDVYYHGAVIGLSPESDVALKIRSTGITYKAGGAANTAANLAAMGCKVHLFGVVGDDEYGGMLCSLLRNAGVEVHPAIGLQSTIRKIRVVSSSGRQLLRYDIESSCAVHLDRLLGAQLFPVSKAVVVSDYAKGVVTGELMQFLLKQGPCIVDPKGLDFRKYGKALILTPNEHEFNSAMRSGSTFPPSCAPLYEADFLAVTLADKGARLISVQGKEELIPVRAREVVDPAGCGDSFTAGLTLAYVSGIEPMADCCRVGCAAGAVSASHVGVHVVTRDELLEELTCENRA